MEQKNNSLRFMAISGWALSLILVCTFIARGAWVTPTANPPGENISAPLNVGSSNQTKQGSLTLSGPFTAATTTLFQGTTTFTPTANNVNQFKVTNATGTELFKIDSVNSTTALTGGGTSLSLGASGASLGALTIGSTSMNFGLAPGFKLGIGKAATSDNLEVAGTINSTGNIKSTTGFCIGVSCITEWPTGGSGSGVPSSGIILSQDQTNPLIEMQGYTLMNLMGVPYTVTATAGGMGGTLPLYLFQKQ